MASAEERNDIVEKLEDVRQELNSTSRGVDFLLTILERVKEQASQEGVLKPADEVNVQACVGFANEAAKYCLAMNAVNRKELKPETQTPAPQQADNLEPLNDREKTMFKIARHLMRTSEQYKAEKYGTDQIKEEAVSARATAAKGTTRESTSRQQSSTREQRDQWAVADKNKSERDATQGLELGEVDRENWRTVLAGMVSSCIRPLKLRKQGLELIEQTEAKSSNSVALLDPSTSERFSRAETAVDRRMYRALAALTTLKAQDSLNLLPDPGPKRK